jgi:predicted SAM-dependent methyltransferase
MKKLNLGCGYDYKKGWINLDFDKSVNSDVTADLTKKLSFKNNDIDFILLQDVLEHLTKEDAKNLLKECFRILKANGKIKIRIPDIYQIFNCFKDDPEVLFRFIYGDTSINDKLGTHKFGYSKKSLEKLLKSIGYVTLDFKNEATNIICLAKKDNKEISLNNIAFSLLDSGGYGGAENFLYQFSRELLKKIDKLTFFIFNNTLPKNLKANTKVVIFKFPLRLDFISNTKGLVKSIVLSPIYLILGFYYLLKFKKGGGQLVVITGISDKVFLTPIAKLIKLSVVWIEFGPLYEVFKRNLYLPKILYRLVKDLPDSVICPTNNTKKSLITDARISESIIKVIPCGITLNI